MRVLGIEWQRPTVNGSRSRCLSWLNGPGRRHCAERG